MDDTAKSFTHIEYTPPGSTRAITVLLNPSTWPKVDETGYVPRSAVIRNPNQPRTYFDPDSLRRLADTVALKGQREIIHVTPLTEEEKKNAPSGAWYRIVSGERRFRACGEEYANVPLLYVLVKKYGSAAEEFKDAYTLNEEREGLSHIEDARALHRMLNESCEGNVAELVRQTGKSRTHIEQHLALLRLDLKVQELMSPALPKKSRLLFGTALAIAKLNLPPQKQRQTALEMINTRKPAAQQVRILEARTGHLFGSGLREKPSDVREQLVSGIDSLFMRSSRLCELKKSAIEQAAGQLARDEIELLAKRSELAAENAKVIAALMRQMAENPSMGEKAKMTEAQMILGVLPGWIPADYWDKRERRYVRGTVISPQRYLELYAAGELSFQREKKQRPAHLPDPEELQKKQNGHG